MQVDMHIMHAVLATAVSSPAPNRKKSKVLNQKLEVSEKSKVVIVHGQFLQPDVILTKYRVRKLTNAREVNIFAGKYVCIFQNVNAK